MTTSTHTYTAVLTGSPDLALSVRGGSLQDDDSAMPKIMGDLEIAMPSAATLAALDPRTAKRVKVTCGATFTNGTPSQSRVFDLGLRDREVDHLNAVVRLSLASDEALLSDYAPLADDLTPFTYQASLRSVINYVLGVSISGAALQATPSGDASAQTYADAINLIPNPRIAAGGTVYLYNTNLSYQNDTTFPGAQEGVAHTGTNLYNPTAADSYVALGTESGTVFQYGLQPGKTYVFGADGSVRSAFSGTSVAGDTDLNTGTTLPRERALVAIFNTPSGYKFVHSAQVPSTVQTGTSGTRVSVRFTVPADATGGFLRAYLGTTAGSITWAKFRLSEYTGDPTDTGYFWGSKPTATGYTYAWTGAADASTTKRTATLSRPVDALRWPAGKSAMDYLAQLVQVAGFRLVNDEGRKWTLRPIGYTASGALSIRSGINLIDGRDAIRRDSGLWYDAQATVYTWRDPITGQQMTATDAYAATTPYQRMRTVQVDAAYPGPGRSQYSVQRAASRGRELTLAAVSDWTAQAEMGVSAYLDNTPIQTGQTSRVRWDLSRDEMTVTTRSTDTPASAWELIPVGQTWASQPVGGSWTGEVI